MAYEDSLLNYCSPKKDHRFKSCLLRQISKEMNSSDYIFEINKVKVG
jgi:hypothetical protein